MSRGSPGSGRRPDGAAFVIALGLAALGALLVWEGMRIPDRGGYAGVGPGDVPKVIGGCLIALGAWTALQGALKGTEQQLPRQNVPGLLWITGGLALQLALLSTIGFSLATGLLFACTAAAFGKRNFLVSLPAGVGLAFVVYGVFDRLLKLNLPAGPLETLIYGG
jgi:putative tricarboxylic transport membrane protein